MFDADAVHIGRVGARGLGEYASAQPIGKGRQALQELCHDRKSGRHCGCLQHARLVALREPTQFTAQFVDSLGTSGIGEMHHHHSPCYGFERIVRANSIGDCHALEQLVARVEVRTGHQLTEILSWKGARMARLKRERRARPLRRARYIVHPLTRVCNRAGKTSLT